MSDNQNKIRNKDNTSESVTDIVLKEGLGNGTIEAKYETGWAPDEKGIARPVETKIYEKK